MIDLRIHEHPILKFDRGRELRFIFEGKEMKGYESETIAAALYASGLKEFMHSFKLNRPRGIFCAIGVCASCAMRVNGVPNIRTCIAPLKEGTIVERQERRGEFPTNTVKKETKKEELETDITVIGGGPAGLSAAIYAAKYGAKVVLIDKAPKLGGQLIKQTHKFFGSRKHDAGVRGIDIAEKLIKEVLDNKNITVLTKTSAFGYYEPMTIGAASNERSTLYKIKTKKIIMATGAAEKSLIFENNDLPGVYGAGAAQTLMNVYGVKPGDNLIMVGAGNVGVIVAYQLLQAGVNVKMIVEAMPKIGAYFVHAAKVRRMGVPILTRHSIKRAYGDGKVEGATIVQLDDKWQPIPGTERDVEVDGIAISVGLRPTYGILDQAGVKLKFVPELGGHVALRNKNLETSVKGIYIAGDVAGIEEASTAIMEGRIAGLSAAIDMGLAGDDAVELREKVREELKDLRAGPFGERIRKGLEKVEVL